ncbi:MAG: hypothetical protein KJ072_19960 [Verrucomicrobia bacterium]|nr:hypothetical protein [Verrucomicrobiota bacterium]
MLKRLAKIQVPLLREVSKWPEGLPSVTRQAIWPVVLWMSLVAVAFNAVGSAYTVAGRYAFEAPSLGVGVPEGWSNQGTFEVIVDGCRWRIECQPEPMERAGGPPLIYQQFLATHDGQTIYELRAAEIPPGFLTSSGAPPENFGHAEMENGPMPQRLDSRLQHHRPRLDASIESARYERAKRELKSLLARIIAVGMLAAVIAVPLSITFKKGRSKNNTKRHKAESLPMAKGAVTHLPSQLAMSVLLATIIATATRAATTEESATFPLKQFQEFVNHKRTIETLEFRVRGEKYPGPEQLTEGTFRIFSLRYENDRIYRLMEDISSYLSNMPSLELPTPRHGSQIVELVTNGFIQQDYFSRFGDQFWRTFNVDGVITTSLNDSNQRPSQGPAAGAILMMGVAYDLLNLGIMDLCTNGVVWEGLGFTCTSNIYGFHIDGHLVVNERNLPLHLDYYIHQGGNRFHYRASYTFTASPSLPRFFPSSILLQHISNSTGGTRRQAASLTSEYDVGALELSDRRLSQTDVSFALLENASATRFVYDRGTYYIETTNQSGHKQLARLQRSSELGLISSGSRWFIALFVMIILVPFLFFLKRYWSANREHHNTNKGER